MEHVPSALWRSYCDELYCRRFGAWLGEHTAFRALKTDIYDEAVSSGLYPLLHRHAREIYGIDLLPGLVQRAQSRYPDMFVQVGDTRRLDFPDRHFGLVVSNSTLDHFELLADLGRSLQELYRVLEPGGILLISLDNANNPVVWLRRQLALRLGSPLPLMPYFPGHTLSQRGLSKQLQACGFQLLKQGYWLHAPRLLAVQACGWLDSQSVAVQRGWKKLLSAFEILESAPTRGLTGHYVTAMARRPSLC